MKGQLFSFDFLIAMSIFLMVIGLIFYVWVSFQNPRIIDTENRALSVSEFLVSSKLGSESMLDCGKTTSLAAENYNQIKTDLNVAQYDVFVQFKNTTPLCNGNQTNIGAMLSNKNTVASAVRFVNLDNQNMQMLVMLYVS